MKRNRPLPPIEDNDSEINTVYGDMITFIMMLFVLLFILSYNEKTDDTFFVKMRIKFGAEKIEQEEILTTESLLVSEIQGFIKEEKLDELAQLEVDEQKIKLILYPTVLFDSGQAELRPEGQKILKELGAIIANVDNPIIVEGHTDNVPIKTARFDSNWDLSFYRSYSVVKFLIAHYRMNPKQLSALGYGEYHPIASNDTLAGRSKNRRIEINIIRVSQAQSDQLRMETK